ncbi:ytfK [Klebsiella pneumoniae subsp. rhinoscleromatis SB3432]|nr:ytfK [Klebsiella pneumoniae subsp. rhinoscleromatis SB3432]
MWHHKSVTLAGEKNENFPTLQSAASGEVREDPVSWTVVIKDVGAFEFDKGKILIPKVKDKLHLSVMSEVNRQVLRLQTEMA